MTLPDPMALPAPPELLRALLVGTYAMHVVALGLLVSGLWLRVGAEWSRKATYKIETVHRFGVVGLSMVITTAVAPLLFVQVLYGRFFYASSITIGYPWLAVVGYLMVGFYSLYLWRWRWDRTGGPSAQGKAFLILTILCVFAVGFTISWNHLLSLAAAPWATRVSHPHIVLRLGGYLGSILIAAAAWLSWLRTRLWTTGGDRSATAAAVVGGALLIAWSLLSAHADTSWAGAGRILQWAAAILAVIAAATGIARTARLSAWIATVAAVAGSLGMALQRESYRLAVLGGEYTTGPVNAQWGPLAMFLIFLVAGLATLVWIVRVIRRPEVSSAAPSP
ncbi:MAG TPA: hypothetical protein VM118_01145 [Acidobacteriota bacterium]|nr:hypothetical protein [Acidobacteriota bacterium]